MRHTYAVGRRAANANKLWCNKNERRQYDDFANLYSIIKMIDKLEKAYVNSTVASAAYDASCAELIAKYKTLRTVTEDSVPNVQHFMVEPEALLCFHGLGLHFRLTIYCKLPLHEGHLYDALYFGSTPIASWST